MQDLHQAQKAAVLSTNHVVDKITKLADLTQDEFQRINASAILLKQALSSEPDPMARWWGRTWPRLVQLVLNSRRINLALLILTRYSVDSQQLAYVPVFQALSFFMGPLSYIFRSFLSSVMVSSTGYILCSIAYCQRLFSFFYCPRSNMSQGLSVLLMPTIFLTSLSTNIPVPVYHQPIQTNQSDSSRSRRSRRLSRIPDRLCRSQE